MLPRSTAIAAVKAPPSSSRMNETSCSAHPSRLTCSWTASATAHTLSAVPMSTRFTFRCAGTDARCITPGVKTIGSEEPREHPHQRPQAADAAGCFAFGRQLRQPDVAFRDVARADERESVPGRPGDEIERGGPVRLVEPLDERRWIRERLGGGQRLVEEDVTVVDPAQVDAHRAGIDADDARHGGDYDVELTSRTETGPLRESTPRRARDRFARTASRCTPCEASSSGRRCRVPRTS